VNEEEKNGAPPIRTSNSGHLLRRAAIRSSPTNGLSPRKEPGPLNRYETSTSIFQHLEQQGKAGDIVEVKNISKRRCKSASYNEERRRIARRLVQRDRRAIKQQLSFIKKKDLL